MSMGKYSNYIVYVDESGHAAPDPDPYFPCFVLAFCVFDKDYYCRQLAPALQKLKFQFFGHDMAIMHERDIRKAIGPFNILTDKTIRNEFMTEVSALMRKMDFGIIKHVIKDKDLKPNLTQSNLELPT
jgi:hypothetical protein